MAGDPWRALDMLRVAQTHLGGDADQREHGAQLLRRTLEELTALSLEERDEDVADALAQADPEQLRALAAEAVREMARIGWEPYDE